MEKNIIKLNESQLHDIIKESVKRVLMEYKLSDRENDIMRGYWSNVEDRRMPKEKYPFNNKSNKSKWESGSINEMDELSPEFLMKAKKAYQDKYGETGLRDRDWTNFVDREHYQNGKSYKDIFDQKPEWEKRRETNGVKSDPNDLKTYRLKKNGEKDYIRKHINNFDSAISNAMHSPEYADYLEKLTAGLDPLTAAAVKVYYPGDLDWGDEDMFDNFEHGYGEFGDSAQATDDQGRVWKFYRDYQGHNEGGSIEIDELEDITFESPDGKTGSIPSKFWYPDF